MTLASRSTQQVILAVGVGILLGCVCGAVVIGAMVAPDLVRAALAPSPTPTFTATRVIYPTITLAPTASRTPTSAPIPTATPITPISATETITPTITRLPSPTRTPRPIVQHFMLGRPVATSIALANPLTNPDPVYLYGTTRRGDLDVHHGEEFENPMNTPLYAVADGTIVTAGSDAQPICGDDGKTVCGRDLSPDYGGYYGKLVVLLLERAYSGQRVFALYGHMDKVAVSVGDKVKQGGLLGEIGMTGVALGPHVHFEVRLGVNDYAHTRNPILWMTPLPGRGALAGRLTDAKGALVRGARITVSRADDTGNPLATETYSRDRWPAVNSDDDMGENFAMPDLLAGDYIVRVQGQQYAARVTVEEGKLAFIELGQ